ESETIREVRIRSLSHWPRFIPNNESMISAGWFSCNVNDRVICIYCNTICHEWTNNDDPAEVHRRLAPKCPFVISMPSVNNSPKIINDTLEEKFQPSHPTMAEISLRAGFFFTGVNNSMTCFYCNGSKHKWGPKDNPMIEYARWFPHCTYAKHLCGKQLYEKIQASKKKTKHKRK
ncbi:unnamed protein product, partial [Rotaria sp. Silwood2]